MQAIDPNEVGHQSSFAEETIPALQDAKYYFCLAAVGGQDVLCVLDTDGKWRPTSYDEMMGLMK